MTTKKSKCKRQAIFAFAFAFIFIEENNIKTFIQIKYTTLFVIQIMPPFVLLIMNCEKYKWKADQQRETWLSQAEFKYYHVLANTNEDFHFDEESKILRVNVDDDYNSLPKKVIAAYAAIRTTFPDCKYIFKTDDDQMLQAKDTNKFFNMILGILERKKPKVHYAGNIVNVPQAYLSRYHRIHPELPEYLPVLETKYCSGRFYVLSMEAIDNLLTKREKICCEYLEDYAIGYHLDERFKDFIFFLDSNKYFQDYAGAPPPARPPASL